MRQSIFESAELSVIKVAGERDDVVFVTFEPLNPSRTDDREGFGESFFARRGFTAYHFLAHTNSWYQLDEMPEALARVRADIAPGTRVIGYGTSMGSYAAIRFSEALKLDTVIAFSPQASVDPQLVRWETRWAPEGARLMWDRNSPRRETKIYALFDPLNLDRRHISRLRREVELEPVHTYFSGHGSIGYVMECGLLESVILDIVGNRFNGAELEARLWRQRASTPTYAKIRGRKRTGILRRFRYYCIERMLDRRLGVPAPVAVPEPSVTLLPERQSV
ncbi:alpha/beta hydrolase [Ancylobacter amanitiformis]|uniref:Alpha/beta hydrolase n=1 Tax=Ancylobacter amanitiformis TaxID=217069 RepID=A0ABU0LMN4_9HYPH|nr:alpha/beta hydrolase [Ancylobacter amanitiformis]MDQ0509966.1 hypothetical protein [Ancylobacter amanitiformis]